MVSSILTKWENIIFISLNMKVQFNMMILVIQHPIYNKCGALQLKAVEIREYRKKCERCSVILYSIFDYKKNNTFLYSYYNL